MADGEGDEAISVASPVSSASPPPPDDRMTKISRHVFADDRDRFSEGDFSIEIVESIQEEYGMFVWPCAVVLAEYVWQQRSRFGRKSVVELGGGTSLPGLVAAKVGADVTLTDDSKNPEVLDNMRRACGINGLNCKITGIAWGEWDAALFGLKADFVLGADVLYDNADFEDLFATASFLMRSSPGCVFVTSYHNRSGHHLVEYLMSKWGFKCTRLLDAFSFVPASKAAGLHGSGIQLVEMMLGES